MVTVIRLPPARPTAFTRSPDRCQARRPLRVVVQAIPKSQPWTTPVVVTLGRPQPFSPHR